MMIKLSNFIIVDVDEDTGPLEIIKKENQKIYQVKYIQKPGFIQISSKDF